jgi:hypothetical protein
MDLFFRNACSVCLGVSFSSGLDCVIGSGMICTVIGKGDSMYCHKCGELNADNAYQCDRCGEILQQAAVQRKVPATVPNYLAQSILVTLFCCLPLGIPAIVYAAQVNGKLAAGDIQGARESSRKARVFCWWSFGLCLGGVILYYLFIFLFAIAAGSFSIFTC